MEEEPLPAQMDKVIQNETIGSNVRMVSMLFFDFKRFFLMIYLFVFVAPVRHHSFSQCLWSE